MSRNHLNRGFGGIVWVGFYPPFDEAALFYSLYPSTVYLSLLVGRYRVGVVLPNAKVSINEQITLDLHALGYQ